MGIDVSEKETVWLTQAEMAKLFGVDRTRIVRHHRNIFESPKEQLVRKAHRFKPKETVWLTQTEMAELFDTNVDTIGLHLRVDTNFQGQSIHRAYLRNSPINISYTDTDNKRVIFFFLSNF